MVELPSHLLALCTELAAECGGYVPELTVKARHSDCPNQSPGLLSKCQCKKYIYVGRTPQSKERLIATYSRSWEQANAWADLMRKMFDPEKRELMLHRQRVQQEADRKQVLIEAALDEWIADLETTHKPKKIQGVYYTIRKQLKAFAAERGLHFLHELTTAHLTRFRSSWNSRKKSGMKTKQSRLTNFFAFCVRQEWIAKNPAGGRLNPDGGLSKIEAADDWEPMVPLSQEQFQSVLDACNRYPVFSRHDSQMVPLRVHTFTELLRWSALSPIDALKLRRDQLGDNDVLTLARAKTGKPLSVLLPDYVADALRNVPPPRKPHRDYFFWSGPGAQNDGALRSMYFSWYEKLWPLIEPELELYTLTGKRYKPHPYIFRATFAVEYLSAGGDVHDLAKLMGNTVAMIEKHYVPLVPRLRDALLDRQAATFAAQGARRSHPAKVVPFKRFAGAGKAGF